MKKNRLLISIYFVMVIFTMWTVISAELFRAKAISTSEKFSYPQELLNQVSADIRDQYNLAFQRIVIADVTLFALIFLIYKLNEKNKV